MMLNKKLHQANSQANGQANSQTLEKTNSRKLMSNYVNHEQLLKMKNSQHLSHLLALCKNRDKSAFSQLYQLTSAKLNGIAYRITRNVDSANEVLQEAFIQIWQNCGEYQQEKSEAFTWLAAIVRYRSYDRLRYDKRRHQNDMVQYHDSDNEADSEESSNETKINAPNLNELNNHCVEIGLGDFPEQALNDCLSKLEQKQSQSILMAYLYGYSRDEISDYFDCPVNTIKSWIRRGLGRLQLCLSQ